MDLRLRLTLALCAAASCGLRGQVIEFESGGLKYQTLSKRGVTVMFALLPTHLREYTIVQIAVSNGGSAPCTVRPEDFSFQPRDGGIIPAAPARRVVDHLIARGSRNDVIKLVAAYESSLYGIAKFRSTNGYEQRRQAAIADLTSTKLKAAAAASAIALVEARLTPGQSTDGAVFFPSDGKPLGLGRLRGRLAGETFEFQSDPDTTKSLRPSRVPSPQ
jgi:hypothetical protein